MSNILITGGSRGLGAAFSTGVPDKGDTVWLASQSRPSSLDLEDGITRHWIESDLAADSGVEVIRDAIGDVPLDTLIYNAGIWEDNAWGEGYDLADVPADETRRIIAVNLTSAILCVQYLIPNLIASGRGRVILIGSSSGLENVRAPEVAYGASKFGMRGAAHALREALREDEVGVTILNPGSIGGRDMPYADLCQVVRCVIGLSMQTNIKEIDLGSMQDRHV